MSKSKLEEYREALRKIEKSPKDRIGILGEVGIVDVGLVAGTVAAGGVLAYGVSQFFKSGNISDERTEQNKELLKLARQIFVFP
jgi:hypothetical protein